MGARSLVATSLLFVCTCGGEDAKPPPPWQKGLPQTTATRRGLRDVRGLLHLHSVYSHDACDNTPLPNGQPAQPCFQDLRDAVCAIHEDFALLTDHSSSMSQQDWPKLFIPMPGDEAILKNGIQVAARWACPDGFKVLAMVGGENELMPVGLESQVADDAATRDMIMTGGDHTVTDVYRAHGGLVWVAHGESHTPAQLIDIAADGTEIYNLHANIDPKIRAAMGLTGAAATAPLTNLGSAGFLANRADGPVSDLAFLAIFEENPAEIGLLETLWGQGRHLTASLGSDAHENAVPIQMADGERGDSYRRVMRWFSNHVLVTDVTPDALKDALSHGRAYGVFELFGSPDGFDYRAESGGEMGDTVAVGSTLTLSAPAATDPLRLRILRIDSTGSHEVATGDGKQPLTLVADQPGVYRAEIRITPNHLKPYMGFASSMLLHEFVWVYANPIYVQ